MERRTDTHEHDPHFDEDYNVPISDPTASASESMGVHTNIAPSILNKVKSPYNFTPKRDLEMEKFSKFFEGNYLKA